MIRYLEIKELKEKISFEETENLTEVISRFRSKLSKNTDFLVLLGNHNRFICVIDFQNINHVKMNYGVRYKYKGVNLIDIAYYNAILAISFNAAESKILSTLLSYQKEMLYYHYLYLKNREEVYRLKTFEYKNLILSITSKFNEPVQKNNPNILKLEKDSNSIPKVNIEQKLEKDSNSFSKINTNQKTSQNYQLMIQSNNPFGSKETLKQNSNPSTPTPYKHPHNTLKVLNDSQLSSFPSK